VDYFRVFGCKCFILNKKSKSSKFAPKVDEGFLLGYATNEHGYRVFNEATSQIEIAVDVTFDESDGSQKEQVNAETLGKEEPSHQVIKKLAIGEVKPVEDEDDDMHVQIPHDPNMHHGSTNTHGDASTSRRGHDSREQARQDPPQAQGDNQGGDQDNQDNEDEDDGPIQTRTIIPHPRVHQSIQRDHPVDSMLGDIQRGVTTRSCLVAFCEHYSFVSSKLPEKVEDALKGPDWGDGHARRVEQLHQE
jgi:hypothetical protein